MRGVVCTITPNPALDLSGTVKKLKANEKAYVFDEHRAPGGNAINCARILHRLRVPTVASGFVGGSTGDEIKFLLEHEGLVQHFIKIAASTRINITVSNQNDHQQTRLSFPGPKVERFDKRQLLEFVKTRKDMSWLVLGGSLPSGFNPADLIHLMKAAKSSGAESIVDCPGDILAQVLEHGRPLLIKPNLEEFQVLTKSRIKSISSVIKKSERLLSLVQMVCVSSVEGGAVLVSQQGAFFGKIPRMKIRSTVGAGDSMVGAMVTQLYQSNRSAGELLQWGLAAAAATLSESGTALGQQSEIKRLYKMIHVEKI